MGNGIDEAESKEGLTVTPQSIDFGSLTQGQGATAKLEVRGGPGSVTALSDYLKVSPGSFTSDSSDIEVRLLGGSEGELVWDDIVLKTDSQEIRVSVTAQNRHNPTCRNNNAFESGCGENVQRESVLTVWQELCL